MRGKVFAVSLVTLSILAFTGQGVFSLVHGQVIGTVCISDPLSTSCVVLPLAVSALKGTQIQIAVNIQGSDPMNGFDIFVKADPTVLNAVGLDLTGSVLGTNIFTVSECIGNTGFGCNSGQDGPGVVEVAAVSFTSTTTPTPGRLFSITYHVTSNAPNLLLVFHPPFPRPITPPNHCFTTTTPAPHTQ